MNLWDRVRVFFMGTEKDKDKGGVPHQLTKISGQLDTIISLLEGLPAQISTTPATPPPDHSQDLEDIMSAVTDLTDAVDRQSTVIDSAVTLLNSLAQQIRENVDNSEALNALADEIDANTQELAQAVDSNDGDDAAPPVEPPPVDPNDVPHPDQTLPGDLPQG